MLQVPRAFPKDNGTISAAYAVNALEKTSNVQVTRSMIFVEFNQIFTDFRFHPNVCQFQGHRDDFMARHRSTTSNEIIVEFIAMGSFMRVSAMDTASLTEVFIQGPINADRGDLTELAKQKLAFVLAKKGHRAGR